MDPNASKSKSKKSMRVATLFTGVAVSTLAMTQAANAQDVVRPIAEHDLPGPGVRPDTSIRGGSCLISRANWVHLGWSRGPGAGYSSYCYGFKGKLFTDATIEGECGGNNHGTLYGSISDVAKTFNFGPGTTYALFSDENVYHVGSIYIKSWTGGDKCNYFNGTK